MESSTFYLIELYIPFYIFNNTVKLTIVFLIYIFFYRLALIYCLVVENTYLNFQNKIINRI